MGGCTTGEQIHFITGIVIKVDLNVTVMCF